MARKEKKITIDDRGEKLEFIIREMPATRLENWLFRAIALLFGSLRIDTTKGTADASNMAKQVYKRGLASLADIDPDRAKPLYDEILTCCSRLITENSRQVEQEVTLQTADGYIRDVKTLFILRKEAFLLNFGFLKDAVPQALDGMARQVADKKQSTKI